MDNSRKEFLKKLGIISLGACCGASVLSMGGCTKVPQVSAERKGNELVVKQSDFGDNKFLIVSHMSVKAPLFIQKKGDNNFEAVLMLCTHKQCELNHAGSVLVCPCHGSEFSLSGQVLSPPAETSLEKYKVRTEGENLVITL
jgi:cytochrome b6-f complex iron-sulfur subunit